MSKKIAFVNGSPRSNKESCSYKMIQYFTDHLQDHYDTFIEGNALKLCRPNQDKALCAHYQEVLTSDTLVIVSPLYVDNVPSSLLDYLHRFELFTKAHPNLVTHPLKVYAFINCGFLGGYQNHIALEIMEHFATRMHFIWSGGLGVGSGAMLNGTFEHVPREAKMQHPIFAGLDAFVEAIQKGTSIDTPHNQLLVTQNFPFSLFAFMLNMSWLSQSGWKFRKIYAKPYLK